MKSLSHIMRFTKLGQVLSRIVFILSVVGAAACAVGIILALAANDMVIAGKSLEQIYSMAPGIDTRGLLASLIGATAFFIIEILLSHAAAEYFTNVLKAGTPFTMAGAKELRKLGVKSIIHPFLEIIVDILVGVIFTRESSFLLELEFGDGGIIALGIMMIMMSFFCEYGAALRSAGAPEAEKTTIAEDAAESTV